MSYVVLARKYRPRRFDEMAGQEHVVRALGNALRQQRLHHAYLFTGTRGIGKTTVSRILAKSLNCTGPDGQGGITAEPCGRCPACTAIDADRYVDYIELDAASNRSIDEIRDLIERAAYKPAVGRFKVFMIDEAHQLTKDAFNALLKTLEEPPEYLKFVLATTDPEKMLPTVLSRCLQFNLRPMAPEVVQAHLVRVLDAEQVPWDEVALRLLARAARGSMRDALSLADQAIAYGAGQVEEAVVRGMLGSVARGQSAQLLDAVARRDGAALLSGVNALRDSGQSALAALEEMARLLQAAAVEQAVPGSVDDADEDAPAVRALAAQVAADELQLTYSMLLQGRGELALTSDEHAALAMVLLRPLAFAPVAASPRTGGARPAQSLRAPAPPTATVRPAPPKSSEGRRGGANPPPSSRPGQPAAGSAGEPPRPLDAPSTELGDRWCALVARLIERQRVSALVRELAWKSDLLAVQRDDAGAVWRLRVEGESLRTQALAEKLAQALGDELQEPVTVQVEAGAAVDSPARRDAAARAERQRAAEQAIADDPFVRDLLQQFRGARIVPGSIQPLNDADEPARDGKENSTP